MDNSQKNKFQPEEGYAYINQYKIIKSLGKGGTAKVKLAKDPNTGKKVALKVFRNPEESKMKIKVSKDKVLQEFKIIEHFKHKNLVNIIQIMENAIYLKKNRQSYETTTIVIEFAEGGEVFEYISHFGKWPENIARTYFHQLMDALVYIHSKGICHRDLKLENLLFDSDFNLKVADFGFARNDTGSLKSRLGTEGYMAPEIGQKYYSGEKVDVFAAGVLLFLFYVGRPPFENTKKDNKLYMTLQAKPDKFWAFQRKYDPFSDELIELLDGMLLQDQKNRYTLKQVTESKWYNGETVSQKELKEYLSQKCQSIQQALEQERLKKKQQQQIMFEGVGKYRGCEVTEDQEQQVSNRDMDEHVQSVTVQCGNINIHNNQMRK